MKKLTVLFALVGASFGAVNSYAQDAAQLKEISMQACETQASQVDESLRDTLMKVCECTVENTDYNMLIEKSAAGDTSFQSDALAVAQQCQKDHS